MHAYTYRSSNNSYFSGHNNYPISAYNSGSDSDTDTDSVLMQVHGRPNDNLTDAALLPTYPDLFASATKPSGDLHLLQGPPGCGKLPPYFTILNF